MSAETEEELLRSSGIIEGASPEHMSERHDTPVFVDPKPLDASTELEPIVHKKHDAASAYAIKHDMQLTTFNQFTYCNGCHQLLVGVSAQGLRCCRCGLCLHARCLSSARLHTCKVCANAPTPDACKPWPAHQWQQGNCHLVPPGWPAIVPPTTGIFQAFRQQPFGSTSSCVVCGLPAGSSMKLDDRRCMWCHRCCHKYGNGSGDETTDCASEGDNMPCTLGPLGEFCAPPNLVTRNGDKDPEHPDEFYLRQPPADFPLLKPLLCFINSKSGSQEGVIVRHQLETLLNPLQIFDLLQDGEVPGPAKGFRFMREYAPDGFRVLVCGGDGTFGWVLEELRKAKLNPAIAVLPLGTGNDLARVLGWGGGFDPLDSNVSEVLLTLTDPTRVQMAPLDRWMAHTELRYEGQVLQPEAKDRMINNYWSIGLDARIALDFHRARQSDPSAFNSRFTNKVQYVKFAAMDLMNDNIMLQSRMELYIDDVLTPIPADAQGIILLNLPSCYGGRNLWGDSLTDEEKAKGWTGPDFADMKLEVVAIRSQVQLGEINTGLALPEKVGQGQNIRIRLLNAAEQRGAVEPPPPDVYNEIACQFDGEPYLQPMDCSIVFSHIQQAKMLRKIN